MYWGFIAGSYRTLSKNIKEEETPSSVFSWVDFAQIVKPSTNKKGKLEINSLSKAHKIPTKF